MLTTTAEGVNGRVQLPTMDTPKFAAVEGTGVRGDIHVTSDVRNGKPRVLMIIRGHQLTQVMLDGEPAVALGLTEGKDGKDLWQLGHLLAEAWKRRSGR